MTLIQPASNRVLRLLVATLKGGTAKTTTAVMLAFALGRLSYRVVVICADTRSQGLSDWRNLMIDRGFAPPVTMLTWRGEDTDGKLSRFAAKAEDLHDADVVIIDTGGEQPEVFMSAALYADHLISPIQPHTAEIRRLPATEEAAAEINDLGNPIVMSVLLNRVPVVAKGAAAAAREFIDSSDRAGDGLNIHVLATEIPRDQRRYADIWGTNPSDLGHYADLAQELLTHWTQEDAA